jgi:hypothetical protein
MASKYFTTTVNPKTGKRYVTIDGSVAPTPADNNAIQFYVNAGYEIRFKSEKRAAAARKRAAATGFGKKKKES